MLEYTKVVFNQTIDDIKKISLIFNFSTQSIYIAYLIYTLCDSVGFIYVNIPLLVISVAYLAFSIVMEKKTQNKKAIKLKSKAKEAYKVAKYIILIPTLVTSIITLATLESDHITFSLFFTIMMVLGYIASVLMLIITKSVESRFELFMVAIKADMEPIVNAYNTFRKFKGERVSEASPDINEKKMRADLDTKVSKIRAESPLQKELPEKMDKQELKEVRKEIIHSIASNIADKAKQKLSSFASRLQSHKTSAPTDSLKGPEAQKSSAPIVEEREKEDSLK